MIAISVLAGYTKAETQRIRIFLVPFACLAAARSLLRRWLSPVLVGATAQAVLIEIFLFTKWWSPWQALTEIRGRELGHPVARSTSASKPSSSAPGPGRRRRGGRRRGGTRR